MGINKVKTYLKEKYLGKGGFAYCMQVVDLDDHRPNKRYAMKIMPKTMNGKTRSKEKIQSEVELLAQMNHPNVARLVRAFENDANVYMVMELCENQSLIELMRNRKRLTEIEVRSYIAQLVGGIQYIHAKNIVHRDLKLGNLFLTQNMQLKIGDFGLSERITYPNQKLNSLSGTPNYIAPEILTKTGHSYEVDIWAVGVIAYTMLVGSPPFQAKTSKATCSRIKQVLYSVPRHLQLSESCIDFIRCCLQKNPFDRIKIDEMFDHEFLQMPYPKLCPMSTLFQAPKELKIAYSTCNGGLSNANRAKSVTQMRRGTRSNQRFVEATDEDIAKDNLERDRSIKKQSKVDLKKVNRNIFSSTPIVEKLANEKQKFSTKMNISSLQSKYHPINNIDIPKVEISTGGSTPFNNSSSSITKLKYTVVTKYMNLPSKSGIGYQLSNGDIGILCNNGDKMLLKLKFDKIFYFDQYDILMYTCKYSEAFHTHDNLQMKRARSDNIHKVCDCVDESCECSQEEELNRQELFRTNSEVPRFQNSPEFLKLLKLIQFTEQQMPYIKHSKVWKEFETPNDVDKPVYIKKWSNCDNRLVFKLNAQVLENSNSSSHSEEDNCIKVLQIVKRNNTEIVLKYNAGNADLVDDQKTLITAKVTDMCKRIIFSGKTSLRQKVKALEKLFQEPNHRIEELKTKYGNKNKSPSRKTPSKEPAKAVIRLSNLGEKSTRGQSSEINPRSNNASLKTSQYFKQMMTTGSNKFTHLDTFTHGYEFAGNQGRFRQSDSWINTPTKYA